MILKFFKTGDRISSFSGDRYRSSYTFTNVNNLPVATFTYANFNATAKVDDRTFQIKPLNGWHTKFEITEDGITVGQIRMRLFNRMALALTDGRVYQLKRCYRSFWKKVFSADYCFQLRHGEDLISYRFATGVQFERGYSNELSGQIELNLSSLSVSILGVFLIEYWLYLENT